MALCMLCVCVYIQQKGLKPLATQLDLDLVLSAHDALPHPPASLKIVLLYEAPSPVPPLSPPHLSPTASPTPLDSPPSPPPSHHTVSHTLTFTHTQAHTHTHSDTHTHTHMHARYACTLSTHSL